MFYESFYKLQFLLLSYYTEDLSDFFLKNFYESDIQKLNRKYLEFIDLTKENIKYLPPSWKLENPSNYFLRDKKCSVTDFNKTYPLSSILKTKSAKP